jgi:hypothetical protein
MERSIVRRNHASGFARRTIPSPEYAPKQMFSAYFHHQRRLTMRGFLALPLTIAALAVSLAFITSPAHAQSVRTWVSGVGDDTNSCSRTAPCKTFAGAIAKTTVNGEINCLDPGGFGTVTITKSITIDCHDMIGTILNPAAYGIQIIFDSFDPSDTEKTVNLRSLSIQGAGNGDTGIAIEGAGQGSSVNIEDCLITGNLNPGTGFLGGIADSRGRGALVVNNTTVRGSALNGIIIGSLNNGSRRAVISNTRVINSNVGINVGANSEVVISHSVISNNLTAGLVVSASTGSAAVDSTEITHNGYAFQNSGTVRLSNSDVAYNSTGWTGTINTFMNNRFTANGAVGPLVPIGTTSNPTGLQ